MTDPRPTRRPQSEQRTGHHIPLEQEVVSVLNADPRFDFQSMHVRVERAGDSIRLVGWVPRLADRIRIGNVAAVAAGRARVENEILVGPPNQRPDEQVASAVRDLLAEDRAIDETSIQSSVHEGVVQLSGIVDTSNHRRYVGALCWWITGVRGVVNALDAIDREPDDDELVAGTIEEVLEKDSLVDRIEVLILNHRGHVTLAGTVASDVSRAAAEEDAWSVEGVGDVSNEIEIAPPLDAIPRVTQKG